MVASEPFGEADVIGVAVGEHHATNVHDRPAHGGELVLQIAPLARRNAGIDQGELADLLDEVAVDEVGADPVIMAFRRYAHAA